MAIKTYVTLFCKNLHDFEWKSLHREFSSPPFAASNWPLWERRREAYPPFVPRTSRLREGEHLSLLLSLFLVSSPSSATSNFFYCFHGVQPERQQPNLKEVDLHQVRVPTPPFKPQNFTDRGIYGQNSASGPSFNFSLQYLACLYCFTNPSDSCVL